ncbi:MAG: aminotransferase class V-fold PLP-dependent enzyme [Rhodospirillales bacterium]|nr:aminotransferase class V-fold PLP-dependent enzyme [Rhodospirillales bacterium]
MTNASEFDVDFVRNLFPQPCWEWSFFENAGGSYVPQSVIDRLTAYMSETQVQPGGHYPLAAKAQARMDEGHDLMAAMIGADPDEVSVSPSTSFNVYVLAQALRPLWDEGDTIIVADQNHEANAGPWHRLAQTGINVVEWKVDAVTGLLDPADLDGLMNERTRLVAFPHVSNLVGEINDVAAITRQVHAAGARVCVDGVAYAPHRAIDVKAWDVDFYLFSFYKIFGPHMGCLYGKREHLLEAHNQYHFFHGEKALPYKMNPAGPQHEMFASLVGIADYFDTVYNHHHDTPANNLHERVKAVFELAARHEEALSTRFLDFLYTKPDVRLIGTSSPDHATRAPTFAFTVKGRPSADIPPLTLDDKVAVSHGNFYAYRLTQALGLDPDDGVVRASMMQYTSFDDVDRLIKVMDRIL